MNQNVSKTLLSYLFLEELKKLPFVEEIWLFGSRARGDYEERSDIDLAIVCPKATDADWLKVMKIVDEPDTLLKIDCIKFNEAELPEDFCKNILKDKRILYMKEIISGRLATLNGRPPVMANRSESDRVILIFDSIAVSR